MGQRLIIGIIVLALIGLGAWWFLGQNRGDRNQGPLPGEDRNGEQKAGSVDIRSQWQTSAHAKVTEEAAGRDPCVSCHTEQGWVRGAKAAEITDPRGITCASCHDFGGGGNEGEKSGEGARLRKTDPAQIAAGHVVDKGQSNLCIACHNARRDPTEASARQNSSGPHEGPEGSMLVGIHGYEYPGVKYENAAHSSLDDGCSACHMAKTPNPDADPSAQVGWHTFRIVQGKTQNLNACNPCHADLTTVNRPARGDYDGNGKIQGVQDEVEGLLTLVKSEIEKKLGTDETFEYVGGKIVIVKKGEEVKENQEYPTLISRSEKLYNAAWNYFFVEFDGSQGIHNSRYAVGLLQTAYRDLTGSAVPNAYLTYR